MYVVCQGLHSTGIFRIQPFQLLPQFVSDNPVSSTIDHASCVQCPCDVRDPEQCQEHEKTRDIRFLAMPPAHPRISYQAEMTSDRRPSLRKRFPLWASVAQLDAPATL